MQWTTGEDKWLRKVIPHEIAHYVHFSAIRTWSGVPGVGLSGTPRWFTEGLAQYLSENWDLHRGDLTLRTAVIEDEMDYLSGPYPADGPSLYVAGNALVRYMANQRGDSMLVGLLKHRSGVFLFAL